MDTRRQPPQTGAPALARVAYGRNLRPIVVATASVSALWTLLWAISSFRDLNLDKDKGFPKLAAFSLALGVMYIITCVIECFGIYAAISRRLPLAKAYAIGSAVSCLLVIVAGLMEVVVHFTDKTDLISECKKLATGASISFRFGLFGSSSSNTLTPQQVDDFCQNAWNRASWSSIITLLLEIILGALFSLLAIAYYRQLLDPTSVANAFRTPSSRMRGTMFPEHYDPPYDTPNLGYGAGPTYAPPPGPPPRFGADSTDDLNKPPTYDGGDYGSKFDGTKKDSEDPFSDFEGSSVKGAKGRERDEFHV